MSKDYVAANLEAPVLDHLFPNMIEADKSASTWPYFRKQIDHPFRVDRRNPTVGFINRDEASILYSNARAFKGRSGIEIGAWRGWSTAYLVAAGIAPLHVVEPLLADVDWRREFEQVIRGAGGGSTTILVPETSPGAVIRLGESGARWSFAFIDGDHDGEAPTHDALACAPYLETTAMVVFHDLVSPHVAAGLRALAAKGWNVMAYQTAQMMGVAWRGTIEPVAHKPDPTQHLARSRSSDWDSDIRRRCAFGAPGSEGERSMTRHLFAMTFVAALAAFGSLPSPASADDAQVARGRYLVRHRRLLGLPHARRIARRAGHEALSWRVGRRLRDSRPGRVRRRESDA